MPKELADLSIAIAMINGWNRLLIATRARHPSERAIAADREQAPSGRSVGPARSDRA
jgi:hypothetical protein